ncbi:inner membrane protein [Magnetospirillum fulvum]|uniref:Inner membrane protein n=2 Tax=Magnetospirillum fulvum TaxID=1082 RepID=A0A1H6JM25_MAGFU|nr:inner membrane protein [Magnetospirillum fulvum]
MTQESSAEPSDRTAMPTETRRSSGAGKVIALLLVLLLAVGGWASFPLWREMAGFPAPEGELAAVRAAQAALADRLGRLEASLAQVAQLEQKVVAVESQAQAPVQLASDVESLARQVEILRKNAVDGPAVARLPAEVEALSRQVEALHKTAADAATLLRLYDRVDQTEAAMREMKTRQASASGLLLAVGQLREAVDRGLPFDAELRTVKVLAADDAEVHAALETIRPFAETGVPTRVGLVGRLQHVAPEIVRAELLPAEQGWSRRAADRMLSLVSIRREPGLVAGNDATSILARAESDLNAGDLAGAVGEFDLLVYGPAEAAAPWIGQAKARLAVDKALSELTAHSIALAGVRP